ncbi:hypothetical protein [Longimicrobium sp.]|nr:hypothetical protein [Longimicrobium sp.]HEX6041874.1 hypothetical protein [Longimicrobium sp.]
MITMEWYEWVFAFCGASMAVSTLLVGRIFYDSLRQRAPRHGGKPRTDR